MNKWGQLECEHGIRERFGIYYNSSFSIQNNGYLSIILIILIGNTN